MNILLVHGLGRTPYSMKGLGYFLEQRGHGVHYFGYAAFAESYSRITERLRSRIQVLATASDQPYVLVCHSLGGVLARSALALAVAPESFSFPAVLIMLGTPNQSPRAARWAWHLWPFQWFAQDCGKQLAEPAFFETLAAPACPYQIIAGTSGWTGTGSPFGNHTNDGLVALDETRIHPEDTPLELPVFHTFMMNAPEVQQAIARWIIHYG